MKTALITGISGQDGAYLSRFLLEKGYRVVGTHRRSSGPNEGRLELLGVLDDIELIPMDLLEITNIIRTLEAVRPDEFYNLAAQSFVALSFEQPILTCDVDALGPLRILEALRTMDTDCRFYQASTSEMFGRVRETPQTESTPFHPRSPYGVGKLFAHWATVNYRESYDAFTCSGILFNHESPLRGREFVTRKTTRTVAQIVAGQADVLHVGNLDSKRDWGFAGDYVEAMWLMLNQEKADDYVVATGETHSVRELATTAFAAVDIEIEWEGSGEDEIGRDRKTGRTLVAIDPSFYRPAEVDLLLGDSSKARAELGWRPHVTFEGLIAMMMESDLANTGI